MTVLPPPYVYFVKGTSWVSRLIRWATGQGPSHAALAWRDERLGWLALTAEWNGWVVRPCSTVGGVSACYAVPGVDLWTGIRANLPLLAAPYDYVGAFLGQAVTSMAWAWLKLRLRNVLKGSGVYCSQITAAVCRDSGVPLALSPSETDPGMLEDELVAAGAVRLEWSEVVA